MIMNASFILQKNKSAEFKKETAGINVCAVIKYFKMRTMEQLKSHLSSFDFYWKDGLA